MLFQLNNNNNNKEIVRLRKNMGSRERVGTSSSILKIPCKKPLIWENFWRERGLNKSKHWVLPFIDFLTENTTVNPCRKQGSRLLRD